MSVAFRITDFMRSVTAAGCSKCGPDVTEQLAAVIRRVRSDFGKPDSKNAKCRSITHWWKGQYAWDINQLGPGGNDWINTRYSGCPSRDCKYTVEVDGQCVGSSRANYIMWGTICNLCEMTKEECKNYVRLWKNVKYFYRRQSWGPLDKDTDNYLSLGYDGWPDSGKAPPSEVFSRCKGGCGKGISPFSYTWID